MPGCVGAHVHSDTVPETHTPVVPREVGAHGARPT